MSPQRPIVPPRGHLVRWALLAAVAGVMVTVYYGVVDFFIGFLAGIKAFTAAVLGGIGSLPGAMLGGLLIGLIEAFWSAICASTRVLRCAVRNKWMTCSE